MSVLNLGAGVQSTTIYLMACENANHATLRRLPFPAVGLIDYAVFADTQDEPATVYQHLAWLESLGGPPILKRTKGRLSDDLKAGCNSTGQRFASIPAFLKDPLDVKAQEGRLRRQCTKEYKLEVIDRCIRREILGLKPRQRVPKDTMVRQIIGISQDEKGRATRLYERILTEGIKWLELDFPLLTMQMAREHCIEFLAPRVPHKTPRSACVFCPFRDDRSWLEVKANPEDWKHAVEVDEALRAPGVGSGKVFHAMYLHRSCVPLVQIEFDPKVPEKKQQGFLNFSNECLGMCGV